MTIDIQHKHASHVIIIEGQAFKANDFGMWDLTDIWKALKLPKTKGPGKWAELKAAKRLAASRKVESSNGNGTFATKQATIRYAAWVSPEFEDVVYDAFEAILEMPEVALLVADKMRNVGNDHSAAILERYSTFNDKCDWNIKRIHRNTQQGLRAAVARGTITQARAIELGLKVSR
ncbi:KilA-N domain-containing protein [Pseudomonas sp. Irchel s3b5]|uniref:KilA-N domain-containing protein n=1 Tax=Pseudomonas sp. Irchel s3b5 TaxID=2009077 RepID=UPI0013577CEF|nr:KilA-N domain-containing protein [Pseudomonas sp. Irchel s3b5]